MNQILIYIGYDQYEYTNYFYLVINDNNISCYPVEKIDDLFQTIKENNIINESAELYIIKDKNASEWEYFQSFQEHNINLKELRNGNIEKLCDKMDMLFDNKFEIVDNNNSTDDISDRKTVYLLFSGNCFVQSFNYETGETLRQAEEILKHGEDEMTELARIIKEKYEKDE